MPLDDDISPWQAGEQWARRLESNILKEAVSTDESKTVPEEKRAVETESKKNK